MSTFIAFSQDAYFSIFAHYNMAIWPAQIIAYALGLLIVFAAVKPFNDSDKLIVALLALSWIWMGIVYNIMHFAVINWGAMVFGAFFVLQGLLLAWAGLLRGNLHFRFTPSLSGWIALLLIISAMLIYPLVSIGQGHSWPRLAMFGIAPPPTVIFTFAMLLLIKGRTPIHLTVLPLLWAIIGGWAAWHLKVNEDLGLLVVGALGTALIIGKNWSSTKYQ